MKRWLLLLLGFTAWGQVPVTTQFGSLDCAAIQRPANQVQSYCFAWPGPPWVLVHNQIDSTPATGFLVIAWDNGAGGIVWQFDGLGGYKYTTDKNSTIVSGTFGGTQTAVSTKMDMQCGSSIEPGGQQTCTITLNQPPLSDYYFSVSVPLPLVGPAFALIQAGKTAVSFQITLPAGTPVASLPYFAMPWSVWADGKAPEWHADILIPCCARADLCGYRLDQVSPEPCAGL